MSNLSARAEAVTRRTYNRPLDSEGTKFETWAQTIERAQVEHHLKLWHNALGSDANNPTHSKYLTNMSELLELRELGLSRKALVSGRTLWLGGTEYAHSRAASQFNCAGLEVATIYDLVDAFWLLLNGCGVGAIPRAGTLHGYHKPITTLTIIRSTNDRDYRGIQENVEILPCVDNEHTWTIKVGDSATSWAKALGKMFISPKSYVRELVLDFSEIRGAGGRLKGYGWICNGYKPLADAMEAIHKILNESSGTILDEQQIGDVINWAGSILSSRRAAEALCLDSHHPRAEEFSHRKFEYWKTPGQPRRQSNNSLLFWNKPTLKHLEELLEFNYVGGEPGFVNAAAAVEKCPWFRIFNPCLTGDTLVAVADGRNAVPIAELAEESAGVHRFNVYSARPSIRGKGGEWVTEISSAVAIMTGVKQVGTLYLSNGDTVRLTADHKIALADGTYIEASKSVGKQVEAFFTKDNGKNRRLINTESDAHKKQCRMIWEYEHGIKPVGYEIDHILNDGGDYLENLQLLSTEAHIEKSRIEKTGENNPIHRVKDREQFKRRRSIATVGSRNPNYSGLTDEYLIELATILYRDGLPITINRMRSLDPRVPQSFSKNRFGGSIENLRKIVTGESQYQPTNLPEFETPIETKDNRREIVTVVNFTLEGEEPVYDLIVEKNRNFYVITSGNEENNYLDCRGILVHNCFEIMLASHGFCNLASVALPLFNRNYQAIERAVYLIARANYRQTCVNLEDGILQPRWHQTNESLRLCGVSLTGIVQADWITDYQIRQLRNIAVMGAYSMADELGLPRPKAVCTIKPEGTRSKISGTINQEIGEGMHRPLGRFIFNWINFSTEDPLVKALEDAGYLVIDNPSDPNNVLVRFPVEYSGCKFDVVNGKEVNLEPATAQLARYLRWNRLWADHNVSATINFDQHEIKDLARMIFDNWDTGYIATAFLPRTDPTKTALDYGHPYLPQEVIIGEEYYRAIEVLRPVDWDKFHTGFHEINDASECPTGVCPVK